jgi:carboxymethylenebutenolidase
LVDVDATLDFLHSAGFGDASIGIVGFCFGGRVSFLTSARREIGAGVGFYGGGITQESALFPSALMDETVTLGTPWLGLFGDQDATIPVEGVEKLRVALQAAPVPTDLVRYPDAGHGFHCDARDSYHAKSAADAWRRTLAWLDAHLS